MSAPQTEVTMTQEQVRARVAAKRDREAAEAAEAAA